MDLTFGQFNVRVAAVIIDNGHVLVHRELDADHWVLPGGRCRLLEDSCAALARELAEELEEPVEVGRLLWFAEMFFNHEGQQWHELSMFYEVRLAPASAWRDKLRTAGIQDGGVDLLFEWCPLARLTEINLVPYFLRDGLLNLPESTRHLIVDELSAE